MELRWQRCSTFLLPQRGQSILPFPYWAKCQNIGEWLAAGLAEGFKVGHCCFSQEKRHGQKS